MKRFRPLLFFALFIGILTAANIYLASRFNFYFGFENKGFLNIIFPALTALMIFGVIPFSNSTRKAAHLIYISAATIMGLLLFLVLSVLLVDFIDLFADFSPKTAGLIALSITFLVSIYGILNSWNVQVTKQEIGINRLRKEIKAIHLSDIHIGHFRGKKFLQKIVEKTNRQKADVVFITGDLFDGRINLNKEELEPLTHLNAPVYFVEGNHDKYTGVETIKNFLRELNVTVLENEMVNFNDVQIIGLNHMRADNKSFNMHASANGSTIKSTLENLNIYKNKPSVLLHHSPDGIQYASEHNIDLYLCGHTHAGQLFPIKYLANLIFDYNRGLHHFNGTRIFVSQGAGTFGPPMRVGTKSEITLITLKPSLP